MLAVVMVLPDMPYVGVLTENKKTECIVEFRRVAAICINHAKRWYHDSAIPAVEEAFEQTE